MRAVIYARDRDDGTWQSVAHVDCPREWDEFVPSRIAELAALTASFAGHLRDSQSGRVRVDLGDAVHEVGLTVAVVGTVEVSDVSARATRARERDTAPNALDAIVRGVDGSIAYNACCTLNAMDRRFP